MGQECVCRAWVDGVEANGKALLESEELIFRGPPRRVVRFADLTSVVDEDGSLALETADTALILELGAQAPKWAHKIRNPRTLADKLDVKPGSRVVVQGVDDPDFWLELRQRTGDISTDSSAVDADLIFLQVDEERGLGALEEIQRSLKRRGAIWIVSSRGSNKLNEQTIMHAGRSAGLVDVKVARFSNTHTALKFVIPVAKR